MKEINLQDDDGLAQELADAYQQVSQGADKFMFGLLIVSIVFCFVAPYVGIPMILCTVITWPLIKASYTQNYHRVRKEYDIDEVN